MSETKYSTDHEYIRLEAEVGVVGISTYAQEQLGDIVYVELPNVGAKLSKGDEVAVIESVKAASELYSPVSGEVVEVNEALNDEPALVNSDAQGGGWIFKISLSDKSELDEMMDEATYTSHTS